MLYLSRHTNCPLLRGFEEEDVPWKEVHFSCLNVLRLYCKIFDKQDVLHMILRKTCQSCKCPRDAHAAFQEELKTISEKSELLPGLIFEKAETFFQPIQSDCKELVKQLPPQDLSAEHCKHLQPHQLSSYEDFVVARNEIALDIGYTKETADSTPPCLVCHNTFESGALGVVATRIGDDVMFHPSCFTCTTCGDLLADLAYCALDDKLYCERHYAEMLKPRCAACDELGR